MRGRAPAGLGRRHLRPAADPDDAVGRSVVDRLALRRRRAGAGRRLRHRAGDRDAARPAPATARSSRSTAPPSMIERARERLGDDRVEYLVADLLRAAAGRSRRSTPSCRPPPSTGSPITTRLFANLAAVMRARRAARRPVRRRGNIARDRGGPARRSGETSRARKHFAAPEETRERCARRLRRRRVLAPGRADAAARRRTSSRTSRRSAWATTSRAWPRTSAARSCTRSRGACPRAAIDYVRLNIRAAPSAPPVTERRRPAIRLR